MATATTQRVSRNTDEEVNQRIRRETERRVAAFAALGPKAIDERLEELEREWDIERALEMMASGLSVVGMTLGLAYRRRYLLLPVLVNSFLFQHAVQGWCPPIPLLRRFGFRTAKEIAFERFALKTLRGDFRDLPQEAEHNGGNMNRILEAVRK